MQRLTLCCACILTVAVVLVILMPWLSICSPHTQPTAGALMELIALDIKTQYQELGLLPCDSDTYLKSVLGSPARRLVSGIRTWTGVAQGLQIETSTSGNDVQLVVSTEVKSGSFFHRSRKQVSTRTSFQRMPADQTACLLVSTSADRSYWERRYVKTMEMAKAFRIAAEEVDPIPRESWRFNRTQERWKWLSHVTGSRDRLSDGWGQSIRLICVRMKDTSIIVSSSAGPDRKWGTQDDLVVKRDAKTGKILETAGFGNRGTPLH